MYRQNSRVAARCSAPVIGPQRKPPRRGGTGISASTGDMMWRNEALEKRGATRRHDKSFEFLPPFSATLYKHGLRLCAQSIVPVLLMEEVQVS